MLRLLIYMPALNEGATIAKVIASIPKLYDDFSELEVLVVDDGSIDNTVSESKNSGASVLSHKYNRGVGAAFQTAVNYALQTRVDVLVSIDADGQFDVNQIGKMVKPILINQADFCIGNRFSNTRPTNMPLIKHWGNKQVNKIVSFASKTKIEDASCGFRAYSRECLLNLNLQGSFTYTHETILDLINKNMRISQIPVEVIYFDGRVSRVANNLFKYAFRTSKIILKCLKDYAPFYFFMNIGLVFLTLAMLLGGFVLIHWLVNGAITPYKSLGIFALSLGGVFVLLTILALVADSLSRLRNNQEKILYYLKKNHYD